MMPYPDQFLDSDPMDVAKCQQAYRNDCAPVGDVLLEQLINDYKWVLDWVGESFEFVYYDRFYRGSKQEWRSLGSIGGFIINRMIDLQPCEFYLERPWLLWAIYFAVLEKGWWHNSYIEKSPERDLIHDMMFKIVFGDRF